MLGSKSIWTVLSGLLILLCFPLTLLAQEEVPAPDDLVDTLYSAIDIFNEEEPMEITLTLDLKKYQREKFKGDYLPVTLHYHLNDSLIEDHFMRIKARGKFRRQHCSFAPFWLNIRKAEVENQQLENINRIKVVTHCNGGHSYADYVLKEYLAYKIYNILSPVSFRVRLIKMRYVDTGRKNKVTEGWAFMIEPEALLAERIKAVVIKNDKVSMRLANSGDMDRVAQFMYLIGNPDYSVLGRHNLKLLGMTGFGSRGYTPVPYDFDYSGLVNAYYAIPGEGLGIESVTERYYLGACREDSAYQIAMDHLAEHREEILQLVHEFPLISSKVRKQMAIYLESYFKEAEGKRFIEYNLRSTCR